MSLAKKILNLFSALVVFLLASVSVASPSCNYFRSPGLERQLQNCETIFNNRLVPNKAALAYSIKYMMSNLGGLKDSSCALASTKPTYDCPNCADPEWIKKGVENNCSFVINDLQTPWDPPYKGKGKKRRRSSSRTTGYFVDLCATKSKDLVKSFYFNGAPGKKFDDSPTESDASNSSVLAGAFLLDGRMSQFSIGANNSRGIERYKKIVDTFGHVPAIHMVGLNSNNNKTEFNKPIHVSAYGSGLGCPGVSPSTAPILEKIVARGSSLYMAYAGKKFEEVDGKCDQFVKPESPSASTAKSAPAHESHVERRRAKGAAKNAN